MPDTAEVQRAVRTSFPFVLKIEGAVHESFPALDSVVGACASELGQENIQEALSYCVKELVLNAEKANAKRIYFAEQGLDLFRPADYEKGMKGFRAGISENLQHFLEKLRENRATIEVTFHYASGALTVSVRNDGRLAPAEQARIRERLDSARASRSFSDALETSLDHTEGAGLGIVMVLQFLKSIGVTQNAFSIRADGVSTVAAIVIPISSVQLDQIKALAEALVRSVDSLPHFPENVVALQRLMEDPRATIASIASHVSRDPSLTAELLRHVNSAYYGLPSRITSIPQAVKLVGLRSLHQLLYSFGYHLILEKYHPRMKYLWEHSLRVAFYSFSLARDVKRRPDIQDDAYVAGILHDLGSIVVTTMTPKTRERMRRFCAEKSISPSLLERFSYGMSHAEVGALIAQKWNFPDQLVEGIRYHHDPLKAGSTYRNIVSCVYLANGMCDLERDLAAYPQLEARVLADFGLRTRAQFLDLAETLRRRFEQHQAQAGSAPR